MLLPDNGEQDVSDARSRRWELGQRLSLVRERIRHIREGIFTLACQLQRKFDAERLAEALLLVSELKTLQAYEEKLTDKVGL